MKHAYPLTFVEEDGDVVVRSRDFPELLTSGETEEEAFSNAADALEVVALTYLDKGKRLPKPGRPAKGEKVIYLPAKVMAKIAVLEAFEASGITKSELARRMGIAEGEARRILDPRYGTKLDKLDAAARALGQHLVIELAA